ncbi:WW domain-containing adapter protein with coiled-coil, partial [Clonorchis sinensis]
YSGHSSDSVNHRAKRMGAARGRSESGFPSTNQHRPQKNAIRVCGDWSEQLSSKGKIYFYNCITEVSQWQKPPEWKLPDMDHDELLRLLGSREQGDGMFTRSLALTFRSFRQKFETTARIGFCQHEHSPMSGCSGSSRSALNNQSPHFSKCGRVDYGRSHASRAVYDPLRTRGLEVYSSNSAHSAIPVTVNRRNLWIPCLWSSGLPPSKILSNVISKAQAQGNAGQVACTYLSPWFGFHIWCEPIVNDYSVVIVVPMMWKHRGMVLLGSCGSYLGDFHCAQGFTAKDVCSIAYTRFRPNH